MYLNRSKKTPTQNEISVGEIGDSLQKNPVENVWLVQIGEKLVQLQNCQIRLQIVQILRYLKLHVPFKFGEVIGIIPGSNVT